MDKVRLGRFDKWGYKNSFSKGELVRELVYMNEDYDVIKQQLKKKDEVIEKTKNWIIKYQMEWCQEDEVIRDLSQLLQILEDKETDINAGEV